MSDGDGLQGPDGIQIPFDEEKYRMMLMEQSRMHMPRWYTWVLALILWAGIIRLVVWLWQ